MLHVTLLAHCPNGSFYKPSPCLIPPSFYWYFPAAKPKVQDPPLVIWFQGGPGSSSMIGLFYLNGPFRVNEDNKLERRPFSWTDEYSVLFIDQPVGTGYSYVTRRQDTADGKGKEPDMTESQLLASLDRELKEDQRKEQRFWESLDTLATTRRSGKTRSMMDKSAASFENKIRTRSPLYWNGYVKDQRGVVEDLLSFLDQFYQRYPEVQSKDLYLTGESYAGKYVPALAYGIMERNKELLHSCHGSGANHQGGANKGQGQRFTFPLKGIAMGNSLTDPISQIQVHADQGYYMGFLTKAQADKMREYQDNAVAEATLGRFVEANQNRQDLFELFGNATGSLNWYDVRKGSVPNDWTLMEIFMNSEPVKDSLNVFGPRIAFLKEQSASPDEIQRVEEGRSKTRHFRDPLVLQAMDGDIMRSTVWMVSELLQQGIKVMAYQGAFDFRDGVAGSNAWVESLEWPGQADFLNTTRALWLHNNKLAGYVTKVPGLSRVVVLGAGHMASMDQGENVLNMLRSFIEDTDLGV
ncbi:hypothetical protein BGX31_005879 [Mortierella sp. GBA43]|nr:hypothetical protein BGX31_005879 [Mortierella sp. GBA43]